MNTAANPLGRCIFVRPVADSAAAGNEEHGDGSDARHEKRIVIGAADHALVTFACCLCRLLQGIEDRGVAGCWRIGVDHFGLDGHATALCDFVARGLQLVDHPIASRSIDVANVGFESHAAKECC